VRAAILYTERVPFETVEHTGDLAVRLRAPDFPGLVAEGIRALAALLFEGTPAGDAPSRSAAFEASGVDPEDCLVQALSEALHVLQEQDLLPVDVSVEAAGTHAVRVRLEGHRADGRRLRRVEEIKAVTYHGVEIQEQGGSLETIVVFDV
jgi:SHS2 domain-containing protein